MLEIIAADASIFRPLFFKRRCKDTNKLSEFPADTELVNYTVQETDSDREGHRFEKNLMILESHCPSSVSPKPLCMPSNSC